MPAIHCEYRFYFKDTDAVRELASGLKNGATSRDILSSLLLEHITDLEKEIMIGVRIGGNYLDLLCVHSANERFNLEWINRFLDHKSRICKVSMSGALANDYAEHYFFDAQEIASSEYKALVVKYDLDQGLARLPIDSTETKDNTPATGINEKVTVSQRSALVAAWQNNNIFEFESLLVQCAHDTEPGRIDCSILMTIAECSGWQSRKYIEALINKGADVSLCDRHGASLLWYLGNINSSLQETIHAAGGQYSRPLNAYSNQDPLVAMSSALRHNDTAYIADNFDKLAHNDEHANVLLPDLARYNHIELLKALHNRGFSVPAETLDAALSAALGNAANDTFNFLWRYSEQQSLDLEHRAAHYLLQLIASGVNPKAIKHIVSRYPSSVNEHTLGSALAQSKHVAIELMLDHFDASKHFECHELGESYFHNILEKLNPTTAKIFIEAGFDPLEANWDNQTVYRRVFTDKTIPNDLRAVFAQWMADQPLDIAAQCAVYAEDLDALEQILGNRFSQDTPEFDLQRALFESLEIGNVEMTKALVEAGASVVQKNVTGNTPLAHAVLFGQHANCELLLSSGADANDKIVTANDYANDLVDELLDSVSLGEDCLDDIVTQSMYESQGITDTGSSCLMHAAANGHTEIVISLLDAGAATNEYNDIGFTPLHYAATNSRIETHAVLISHGADFMALDDKGNTPLHYAVVRDCQRICAQLIDAGLPIDTRNSAGLTPLLLACSVGLGALSARTLKWLVGRGADIDACDEDGLSCLSRACLKPDTYLIGCLLEAGADLSSVNNEQKSAYDLFGLNCDEPIGFTLNDLVPTIPKTGT